MTRMTSELCATADQVIHHVTDRLVDPGVDPGQMVEARIQPSQEVRFCLSLRPSVVGRQPHRSLDVRRRPQTRDADVAVIFYAGHGIEMDGKSVSPIGDIQNAMIWLRRLLKPGVFRRQVCRPAVNLRGKVINRHNTRRSKLPGPL
jgi:hypothetical protein